MKSRSEWREVGRRRKAALPPAGAGLNSLRLCGSYRPGGVANRGAGLKPGATEKGAGLKPGATEKGAGLKPGATRERLKAV